LLKRSQWWTEDQLHDYQNEQLQLLVKHAYEHVPFYHRVFREHKLTPTDIRSAEDLPKLPLLTKDIIRLNINELVATNIPPRELEETKTSGSTVSPLSLFWQRSFTDQREKAFLWTSWNIAGYRFNHPRVDFSLERVERGSWQYDPLERVLLLPAVALGREQLDRYIEIIHEFRPKVLKSIPSNLIPLARHMADHRLARFDSLQIILCGSEMIYPWQRSLIEKVFGVRLFSWYGQTERVVLGTECEQSSRYHLFPEYGITEIVDAGGLPVTPAKAKGRMVGTGFNNYAMPLVRYQLGDIGAIAAKGCSCGRSYPILSTFEGREQEYIINAKGELIPMVSITYSSILEKARQFQFYQEKEGRITLRVVPFAIITRQDIESMRRKLENELPDVDVQIIIVDEIARGRRGKSKYIIQKLPVEI
jgi:phenylacetate-CoA ligase